MQQSIKKDRYIPIRKSDLIQACMTQGHMSEEAAKSFAELSQIIVSTLHYDYHKTLEILKDCYAPFDPTADTLAIKSLTSEELNAQQQTFAKHFSQVLNAANFERVTEDDLQEALEEESLFKVRLAVEFDDFAEVVFYRRGEHQKTETLSSLFGLRKRALSFTNYDKVAVYIKFKDKAYFQNRKRATQNFEPGSTIIKLFQNVPKADLEMLFPNSEVRMRRLDKAIIGGSALLGGTVVLVTKLGATLILLAGLVSYWLGLSNKEVTIGAQELVALGAGAGVLGGFIFKEWSKFKNRKLKFMKALADNLYFKNLDNNAGVFHHLIDSAEEEECKEAILGYYFLMLNETPVSAETLDQQIENWFTNEFNYDIDFEVEDALAKLTRFGIVTCENGKYRAKPLVEAKTIMDKQWDSFFQG